ncbi:hypothetical protein DL240_07090 [Lujinxingia litoralis]|uniref:DUF4292 domain-containing protein n=1 Tax=Lujinxingia litoralis TaxID=2211119 RepID=A0A328C7I5_9DELT|nr:hypothetical protein [Lujinxingia litoralis]RAL23905.1 hypothetical protein DL240_07090 [Lujinxingia litoralis]
MFLFFGALFVLVGCPRQIPPPDNALEDPSELRAAIEQRHAHIDDARFKEVTLEYFGDGERVRVRQLILVQKPASLRVQTRLPGSDEILNLLVSDGTTFAMHQRDTNDFYTGAPTRENINRLLPVDLSGADVVRVMLGGAPWDRFNSEPGTDTLAWDRRRGLYQLSRQTTSGGTLSLFVRHTDFAVIEVLEQDAEERALYHYTTDGWRDLGGLALPAFRRFVWPDRNLDFSLDVRETQLNISLQQRLFMLAPPAGSRIIEVNG